MNTTAHLTTDEEAAATEVVEAFLSTLPSKLTPADMAEWSDEWVAICDAAAQRWVIHQTDADFEWLRDVACRTLRGRWQRRYLKGVLNCYRAALQRVERQREVAAAAAAQPLVGLDLSRVPAGRYAVPGGDTRLKVLIQRPAEGRWAGWTFVKDAAVYGEGRRYGSQAPDGRYRGQITRELEIIVADPKAASIAYGHLTSTCGRCGRALEDEASVEAGIGPVCAEKGWS